MNHLEAVMEIKNVINPLFISKMIPLIKYKCRNNLKAGGRLDTDIRNVKGYNLNSAGSPTDVFYWNYVKMEIERLYSFYKIKFPKMESRKINQIDLLKNEYEGGDLIFTDQKNIEIKKFKLDKGSIVFFPSNFMYPHSIQPITKGTRYSIVAWLQ